MTTIRDGINNPFLEMNETRIIGEKVANYVILKEIPNKFNHLTVTGYSEVDSFSPASDQFYVDYQKDGYVLFNPSENGKAVTISYMGKGTNFLYEASVLDTNSYLAKSTYDANGDGIVNNAEKIASLALSDLDDRYANRVDVRLKETKLGQTDMTEEFLQQMAGTTPINSVPSNYTITQKKMVEPYLKAKTGRNLFDYTDYSDNSSINSSGVLYSASGHGVTDYLKIDSNTIYTVGCNYGYQDPIAFYDDNKVFISRNVGGSGYSVTFTTPSNAAYVRIVFPLNYISSFQFVLGNSLLVPYEPYQLIFDESTIGNPISASKLDASLLKGVSSRNLFDKSTVTTGKYINYTTGNFGTSASYDASDYIPVSSNTAYVISGTGTYGEQFAYYDTNKTYISGSAGGNLNVANGYTFTTPANAVYVRVSIKHVNLDTYQLELGTSPSEYTAYGSKVDRRNIQDLRPKNVFVIAKQNGDYATITDAVNSVRDSVDNPVTLILAPGVYVEKVNITGRYISLVGINKATCIIQYDDGNYGNFPINAWTYNHLKNLTIISTHDNGQPITGLPAYAVHLDYNSATYSSENVCEIENCKLVSYQHAAIGIGLQNLQTVKLINCELYNNDTTSSYDGGALYCHNKQANGATGQKLIVANCIAKSKKGDALVIEDANHRSGGGAGDAQDTVVTFYNSVFFSETDKLNCTRFDTPLATGKLSGHISLGEDSFGNNISSINA